MSAMSNREFIRRVYSRPSEPMAIIGTLGTEKMSGSASEEDPSINSYEAIEANPERKKALKRYNDLAKEIEQILRKVRDRKMDIKDADRNLYTLYELQTQCAEKVWI